MFRLLKSVGRSVRHLLFERERGPEVERVEAGAVVLGGAVVLALVVAVDDGVVQRERAAGAGRTLLLRLRSFMHRGWYVSAC